MKDKIRTLEGPIPSEIFELKYPLIVGKYSVIPNMKLDKKLSYFNKPREKNFISTFPINPKRGRKFDLKLDYSSEEKKIELVKLRVKFPSGKEVVRDFYPKKNKVSLKDIVCKDAGDFYIESKLYFSDGSVKSDAMLKSVLSPNPDQLVVSPRVWLTSGRAGRVEYDFDDSEFHCRAYGTITNGSSVSRTFNSCSVRVTDGGVSGTLISEFSFSVGPFTVSPGGTARRSIDTWYGRGGDVWDKFNKRWDLTVKFTYHSTDGVSISDSAVYRPMSTIPVNFIKTEVFNSSQNTAYNNAILVATEILEDRDITLYGYNRRILSNQSDRDKYGIIDIGWDDDYWDFDEAHDLYEEISGPDGDRIDLFLPLGFDYTDDVPSDKRNVGGFSTVDGPYPKDDTPRKSGTIVLLDEADHEFFGVAIAHELCHYLGLQHVDSEDNLMHKNGGLTDHKLTWSQWNKLVQHGMMKWLASDI